MAPSVPVSRWWWLGDGVMIGARTARFITPRAGLGNPSTCGWPVDPAPGYGRRMLTIILIVVVILLLTGGFGYSRRGRRL